MRIPVISTFQERRAEKRTAELARTEALAVRLATERREAEEAAVAKRHRLELTLARDEEKRRLSVMEVEDRLVDGLRRSIAPAGSDLATQAARALEICLPVGGPELRERAARAVRKYLSHDEVVLGAALNERRLAKDYGGPMPKQWALVTDRGFVLASGQDVFYATRSEVAVLTKVEFGSPFAGRSGVLVSWHIQMSTVLLFGMGDLNLPVSMTAAAILTQQGLATGRYTRSTSVSSGGFGSAPSLVAAATRPGTMSPGNRPVVSLSAGDRVTHDKFGLGTVVSTSGQGETAEATIDFGPEGTKRLLLRYASVEVL